MHENRTSIGLRAKDRGVIYKALHSSLNEALTSAIKNKIDLTGIDLSGQNLQGINFDGITLSEADFTNCDLTGANMSEARFEKCNFSHARLFDTCFCYSDVSACNFRACLFGVTDVSQARITACSFQGVSFFTVNLNMAADFSGNHYFHDNTRLPLSSPPLTIQGLKNQIHFLDDKIIVGTELCNYERNGIAELTYRLYDKFTARINTTEG